MIGVNVIHDLWSELAGEHAEDVPSELVEAFARVVETRTLANAKRRLQRAIRKGPMEVASAIDRAAEESAGAGMRAMRALGYALGDPPGT